MTAKGYTTLDAFSQTDSTQAKCDGCAVCTCPQCIFFCIVGHYCLVSTVACNFYPITNRIFHRHHHHLQHFFQFASSFTFASNLLLAVTVCPTKLMMTLMLPTMTMTTKTRLLLTKQAYTVKHK